MTPEQYGSIKNQVLLAGSMVHRLALTDLVKFLRFIEDSENLGVEDLAQFEEVRGNTKLLAFITRIFIQLKAELPKNGHTTNGELSKSLTSEEDEKDPDSGARPTRRSGR